MTGCYDLTGRTGQARPVPDRRPTPLHSIVGRRYRQSDGLQFGYHRHVTCPRDLQGRIPQGGITVEQWVVQQFPAGWQGLQLAHEGPLNIERSHQSHPLDRRRDAPRRRGQAPPAGTRALCPDRP